MKHRILIGLLAVGVVAGYGAGFASMRHHCRTSWHWEGGEDHVARFCAEAARRGVGEPPKAPAE